MTLSALPSTCGGIVSPKCFAVFRFMISSNLVGCSTGSCRLGADNIDIFCSKVTRDLEEPFWLSMAILMFQLNVLTIDVPQFPQAI